MIMSMGWQVKLFLLTVLIGIIFGIVYDVIKTMRKIFAHSNIIIQIEDFIYWIVISSAMFLIMLNKNSGQVRGFCIGGTLLGMLLYSILLSKFVVKSLVSILNFVAKIILNVLRIMAYPIRILIKILAGPSKFILNYIFGMGCLIKKYLYISNQYAKIKGKRSLNNLKIIFKKI